PERDLDRAGIDLADRDVLHPGQIGKLLSRVLDVEGDQRGRAVEAEALENVDLRRLAIAGDLHILNGKADRGGRGLRETLRVTADRHAVKAGRTEEKPGRHSADVARNIDATSR